MATTIERPITAKPPRRRSRKLWLTVGVLLALVVGFLGPRIFKGVSLLNSGERIDIGGRTIFISCSGSGSPTVILEHGLGSTGFEWETVQDSIDDTTRVCYTSRAGLGFSDRASSDTARTAQDAAEDLFAVLGSANVSGPYLLVGHSFGGQVVRLFADQNPSEVAGMVLVDSTHEDLVTRVRQEMSPDGWAEVSRFILVENTENMDLEASSTQVAAAGDLGDIPLVVLEAADEDSDGAPPGVSQAAVDELEAVMASIKGELQLDLSTLSTQGRHVVVKGSGHFIQVDRPDAVIDAINSILTR